MRQNLNFENHHGHSRHSVKAMLIAKDLYVPWSFYRGLKTASISCTAREASIVSMKNLTYLCGLIRKEGGR